MKKLFSLLLCVSLCLCLLNVHAEKPVTAVKDNIYLTLVNKQNKLPDDWLMHVDLITTKNVVGEENIVESHALIAFEGLRTCLLYEEGVQIELDSTYRSLEEQQEIWDYWGETYGQEYCEKYLSPVGYSEHHTGLAIDIFIMTKDNVEIRDNDEMIADKADFAKIHAHIADFGFILRYPEGRDNTTGYAYEPWHLRYVGNPVIAHYIMDNNMTLEEYLQD